VSKPTSTESIDSSADFAGVMPMKNRQITAINDALKTIIKLFTVQK